MASIDNIEGGLKGQSASRVKEKTQYKGELRILGIIQDNNKKTVGYVIFVEKTFQKKSFTVEQTKEMLKRFKFSNAKLEGDKIINTECSMDKLYVYTVNVSGQLVCNDTRKTIIGQLMFGDEKVGYKLTDWTGRVVSIRLDEINNIVKNSINNRDLLFVNASIKEVSPNNYIVSAIKEPFTTIEIVKEEAKQLEKSPKKQWRINRRLHKIMFKYMTTVRKINKYPSSMQPYKDGCWIITNVSTCKGTAHGKSDIHEQLIKDLNLIYDVLFRDLGVNEEFFNKMVKSIDPLADNYKAANRAILDTTVLFLDALLGTDKDKTAQVMLRKDFTQLEIKGLTAEAILCKNALMNKFVFMRFCATGKDEYRGEKRAAAEVVEYYKEILNEVPRTQFIKSFVVEMVKAEEYLPCSEEAVRKLSINRGQMTCNYLGNAVFKIAKREKPEFKTSEFKTSQQIAQLGFTLYKKYDGKEFKHDTMVNKPLTLRYICSNKALIEATKGETDIFINENAEELLDRYINSDLCNCFGDIATISMILGAYAVYIRNDEVDIPNELSYYSKLVMSREDLVVLVNIYLTMLAIYNMPLLRDFYETPFMNEIVENSGGDVPYIEYFEEISKEDFDLPERLKLYYESGYNVYFDENNENKLVNLRSKLGSYGQCKHTDITDILASTLKLNIKADSEVIDDFVGNLRYYYYNKN